MNFGIKWLICSGSIMLLLLIVYKIIEYVAYHIHYRKYCSGLVYINGLPHYFFKFGG